MLASLGPLAVLAISASALSYPPIHARQDSSPTFEGQDLVAQAHLTGPNNVEAVVTFRGTVGAATEYTIEVLGGLTNTSLSHSYHIHTNPVGEGNNCTATKGHLDPLGVTDSVKCSKDMPAFCEEGDLSGKHGTLNGTESGAIPEQKFEDEFIRFYPESFSILGRSIVLHGENKSRLACGNIVSPLDGTASIDENGNWTPTNQTSSFQKTYPTGPSPPSKPAVTPFAGTSIIDSAAVPTASAVPLSVSATIADVTAGAAAASETPKDGNGASASRVGLGLAAVALGAALLV